MEYIFFLFLLAIHYNGLEFDNFKKHCSVRTKKLLNIKVRKV